MDYIEELDNIDKTPNWQNRARLIVDSAKEAGLTLEEVMAAGGDHHPEIKKYIEEFWEYRGTAV